MIGNIKRRREIWNGEEKIEEVEESLLRKKIQIEDRYLKSSRQFWQTNLQSLNTNHFQGEQQIDLNAYSQDRDEMEMEIQCKPKIEYQGNHKFEDQSNSEYDHSDLSFRNQENKNPNPSAKNNINTYKQQLEYSSSQIQESFSSSTRADDNEFDSSRNQQKGRMLQDSMFSKAEETDSIDQLLLSSRAYSTQSSFCSSSQQGTNNTTNNSSFQLNPTQPGWQSIPKNYKDTVTDQSIYIFTGTPNILLQEQSIMEGGVLEKLLSNFSLGEQCQSNPDELNELTEFLGMLNENFRNIVNQGEFLVLNERSLFGQDFDSANNNNNTTTILNNSSLNSTANQTSSHTYTLQELRVSDSTYGFITDLQFIKISGHLSSSTSPELNQLQQRARAEQLAVYADQGSKVIYMAQPDPVSIEELGSLQIAKLGVIAAVLPEHLKLSRPPSINTQLFYHTQLKLSATLTHTHTHAFISNYIPLNSVDHEGNNLIEDIYNTNINQMECIRAIDEKELSGLRWQHLVFLRIIEAVLSNVVALQRALDPQTEYTKAGTALDLRQFFETKYCRHRSVQMKLCESQLGPQATIEIRLHFCREMQNNRKIECLICVNKTKNFCVQCSEKQQTMVGFCGSSQCFEKHNQVPAMLLNEQSHQIENIKQNQRILHEQATSFAPAAQIGLNQSGRRTNLSRDQGMKKGADGYVSESLQSIMSLRNQSNQSMNGSVLLSRRQLEMNQHPERNQNQSQISSLSKRSSTPAGKFSYRNDLDNSSHSAVQPKRTQLGSSSGNVSGNTSMISQAYQQKIGNPAKINQQINTPGVVSAQNSLGQSQNQKTNGSQQQQQQSHQQQSTQQKTQQPLQTQQVNKQNLPASSSQVQTQSSLKSQTSEQQQPKETKLLSSSQPEAGASVQSSSTLSTASQSQLSQSNSQPSSKLPISPLPSSSILQVISKTQLAGPVPPPLLPSQVPLADIDSFQPAINYKQQQNQYKKCKQLREIGESSEILDETIFQEEEEEEKDKKTKFIEAQRLLREGRRKGCKILWFQQQDESEAADHADRLRNGRLACNILSNPKLRHISIVKPDSNNDGENVIEEIAEDCQEPNKKGGVQFIESTGDNQQEEIYQYEQKEDDDKQTNKEQQKQDKKQQQITEAALQNEKLRIQPGAASNNLFEEDDEQELVNMLSTPAEKAAQKLLSENQQNQLKSAPKTTKSIQQTTSTQENKEQENNSIGVNAEDSSLSKPTRQVIKSYFAKNQPKN